ncbi:DUF2125 domain-containing protein [Seohaeicola saemankumensis]|nr:DUF2125 domain-containing protein [Seohaeicola saemankumensis]MCA0873633.1 DUF2125 domain-containing protein [Seohaeicola saemankumensis]
MEMFSFRPSFHPLTGAALIALLPSGALADLTAEDVWASHQAVMAALGGTVAAEPERVDDRLVLDGLEITWQLPDDLGHVLLTTDGYQFLDRGDGTVSVLYPDGFDYELTVHLADGDTLEIGRLRMEAERFDVLASGAPEAITYEMQSVNAKFHFWGRYAPPAGAIEPGFTTAFDMVITMADMSQSTTVTLSDLVDIRATYRYGEMMSKIVEDAADGIGEGTSQSASAQADISLTLPRDGVAVTNPAIALRQGARVAIDSSGGQTSSTQTVTQDGTVLRSIQYKVDELASRFAMDQTALSVHYAGSNLTGSYEQPGVLPVPVAGSLGAFSFDMDLPVAAGEARDARMQLSLADVVWDDALWAMVDAGGKLDRGPASFALDVSAKVNSIVDSFDFPAVIAGLKAGERLAEVGEVALHRLALTALGADAMADGAVTLDYSDMESYPGMPKPVGAFDVTLTGVEGVLAQLTAAGLVSEQQVTGVRMMLGSFARPDPEAEGTLRSQIELNGEGQVLANGMRLR